MLLFLMLNTRMHTFPGESHSPSSKSHLFQHVACEGSLVSGLCMLAHFFQQPYEVGIFTIPS